MEEKSQQESEDLHSTPAASRDRRGEPISRRQFLAGAAAAGIAVGASGRLPGAADEHQERQTEPEMREAVLTQYGDKWIISCPHAGKTCAVVRLVTAKKITPFHSVELAKCTGEVNVLFDALIARNAIPGRHPCLILTPYAPFLAWAQRAPDLRIDKPITRDGDPARFYQGLGISLVAYREKPTRFWYYSGAFICRKGGDTQLVAQLITAERPSTIHDAELAATTRQVNAVLDRYAKGNRDPKAVLSLMVTPKGLFLAWSRDDDGSGPLPRGGITAQDSKERIFEALGI